MTEKEDPYHLSGKPLPTTRIAPTNYTETAASPTDVFLSKIQSPYLAPPFPEMEYIRAPADTADTTK